MKVGVLALQGDVGEHRRVLEGLGADPVEVRQPRDLDGLDALVLPGGESTTLSMLLESSGLSAPIAGRLAEQMPAFGTCAGMILLASRVLDGRPDQACFGAIDLDVRRNAFGRQVDSFEEWVHVEALDGGPVLGAFIRAPAVDRVGVGVEVLASVPGPRGGPVVCRQGTVLVAAFHPELSGDPRLHELFLSAVQQGGG